MKAMPLVSVVIVSWNAKDYLLACLTSIFSDASPYLKEVIVVDNASSDGAPEEVASKFPQVQLIRNRNNLGFARANNIGIKASLGDYICLVNSDVKVLRNCITRLVDFCEDNPKAGMVGPRVIGGDGLLQRSCRGFPSVWNMFCRALALDAFWPKAKLFGGYLMRYWEHDTPRRVDILSGCFWLVNRKALDDVGLLDESFFMYGEDMDWCKRFATAGWELAYVPEAEAIHYGGASTSLAPVRFYIEKQRADLQYWRKHHNWLGVQCFFIISCLLHANRIFGNALTRFSSSTNRQEHTLKLNRSLRCLLWLLTPTKESPSER